MMYGRCWWIGCLVVGLMAIGLLASREVAASTLWRTIDSSALGAMVTLLSDSSASVCSTKVRWVEPSTSSSPWPMR